jgi:hypothetical protein
MKLYKTSLILTSKKTRPICSIDSIHKSMIKSHSNTNVDRS